MRGRPVAPVRWAFGAMDESTWYDWFSADRHFPLYIDPTAACLSHSTGHVDERRTGTHLGPRAR